MKTLHRSILALLVGLALTACTSAHVYADALQLDFFLAGFQDVSGAPVSGGIVVTRNSANSAAKAVWEDKDQTLPSAGGKAQFSLDSEGRAVVFGDGVYTVLIYDSADTGLTSPLYTFSGVTYETKAAGLSLKVNKSGDTMTGALSLNSSGTESPWVRHNNTDNGSYGYWRITGNTVEWRTSYLGAGSVRNLSIDVSTGEVSTANGRVLDTADEGSGNGLDADLLDGLDSTDFALAGDVASGVITGVGPTNDALKQMALAISDGTAAGTIKVSGSSVYNSEALAEVDNLAKGGQSGAFELSASGEFITVTVSGNTTAVLEAHVTSNTTGSGYTFNGSKAGSAEFNVVLILNSTGVNRDISVAVDSGNINGYVLYLANDP